MFKRKYVIFKGNHGEYAMLFVPSIQHNHVKLETRKPVAAGFVNMGVEDGKYIVRCYGKSISLKLKSRGEIDEHIIRSTLNL